MAVATTSSFLRLLGVTALALAGATLATGGLAQEGGMTKQIVKDAKYPQAVCNDGTQAIFYFSPGSGDDRNKWILFLQGGGGCMTDKMCMQRQKTQASLLTSAGWPPVQTYDGLLSTSKAENPDFATYTHVYIHYCSSDFWDGDGERKIGGSTWQFRGHQIIDAVLDQLFSKSIGGAPTLAQATEVLVAGTSAGGMGVHNNLDHVAERLPNASVKGIADSAWIPADVQAFGPGTLDIDNSAPAALAYNSDKPDESCVAANPGHENQCLREGFVFRYITTPMFVFADQRDPVLLGMLGILPGSQTGASQRAYTNAYAQALRQSLRDVPAFFVTANTTHTALLNARFSQAAIGGQTLATTIGNWYFGRPGNVQLVGRPGEGKVLTHEAQ